MAAVSARVNAAVRLLRVARNILVKQIVVFGKKPESCIGAHPDGARHVRLGNNALGK